MARLTSLLLVLWVGVTASTVVDLQKRIIGGRDCGPAERLYHVEVRAYSTINGAFGFCGGSLISDRWILTAAHCWDPASTMKAVLGIHPGGQQTEVDITPHFYNDNLNRLHDILLLELTNPTLIQPVPLPDCSNPLKIGDTVEIAGRASTTMGLNNKRTNYQTYYNGMKYQDWKCYQSPGVDISPGDSGGGVVFNGMIYGVNKFSGNPTHACVAPAGFMDVCAYMDWIVGTTRIPRPRTGHGSASGQRPATGTGSGPVSPKKSNTKMG